MVIGHNCAGEFDGKKGEQKTRDEFMHFGHGGAAMLKTVLGY